MPRATPAHRTLHRSSTAAIFVATAGVAARLPDTIQTSVTCGTPAASAKRRMLHGAAVIARATAFVRRYPTERQTQARRLHARQHGLRPLSRPLETRKRAHSPRLTIGHAVVPAKVVLFSSS